VQPSAELIPQAQNLGQQQEQQLQDYFLQQTSDDGGDAAQALLEEAFEALLEGYKPASPSTLATFDEWIDFSSYKGNLAEEDETLPVAATPGHAPSSTNRSTNPRPEANGSSVDASSHMYSLDSKSDE
jgi:hypothetical protein